MLHEQTWVKVNAPVDRGIADLVSILSQVDGLETLESCQGEPSGKSPAFVYFRYGGWDKICPFVFGQLGPRIWQAIGDDATVSVEVFNGSTPLGKISFEAEATGQVTSAVGLAVSGYRSCECSRDSGQKQES